MAIKETIQIPSISEPVSDYFMALSTIRGGKQSKYTDIVQEIEDDILNGKVVFDTKRKMITYKGNDTQQAMDMSDVSSMVSEVSPITAYLKYIVSESGRFSTRITERNADNEEMKSETLPSNIIFIEEPEAHLHPSKQVTLMKILTKLSQNDVKLVMASHSNYVFNELNNLVIAGALSPMKYSPILMKYENGNSHTEKMRIDDLGADDENFSDVTEQIMQERDQLINQYIQKKNQ